MYLHWIILFMCLQEVEEEEEVVEEVAQVEEEEEVVEVATQKVRNSSEEEDVDMFESMKP